MLHLSSQYRIKNKITKKYIWNLHKQLTLQNHRNTVSYFSIFNFNFSSNVPCCCRQSSRKYKLTTIQQHNVVKQHLEQNFISSFKDKRKSQNILSVSILISSTFFWSWNLFSSDFFFIIMCWIPLSIYPLYLHIKDHEIESGMKCTILW